MKIEVVRLAFQKTYTIGKMYIDGVYFCDTLEDTDRGLRNTDPMSKIKAVKVYGETAIPMGDYKVTYTYSPKFRKSLPEILNVPGWTGVRIHSGNKAADTLGCILVGENKVKGQVISSRATYDRLIAMIKGEFNKGHMIDLTIR